MDCITRFFLALLNLVIPITDWDIKVPALATTSTSSVFNLFVIDVDGGDPDITIQASVMRVDVSRSQTEYWITCSTPVIVDPPTAPCNYIHGGSVTVNPTGMALNIHRRTELIDWSIFPVNGTYVTLERYTDITVGGTATCDIYGSTSASCTGRITSSVSSATFVVREPDNTWGRTSSVDIETISTTFADVTAHSIPVTITEGAWKIPTTTTTSSNDGGARATGQAYVVVAGAMALAGVLL